MAVATSSTPVSVPVKLEPLSCVSVVEESTVANSCSNKSWQMEILMEKLRSRAGSFKSLVESSKHIKQAVVNKHHILDTAERASLNSCLDILQKSIKVITLAGMVERLESTAKQLGLKFSDDKTSLEVYISCDMFYVEIILEPDGAIRDVKIEFVGDQNHHGSQSSPELVECLSRGDFTEFTSHLEGFLSIYMLNTEKKNKCKAYQALQALETDLTKLFDLTQETVTDIYKLILKSPVGLLQPRKGGHPMRLVFFISPYELLDVSAEKAISLSYDTIATRELTHYVTLKKPMPLSLALAQQISEVTGIDCFDLSNQQSILSLIVQQSSDGQIDCRNNRGLFVTLPDQQHCYFITGAEFPGVLVNGIPFTHPTHITHILMHLRAQAAFNTLIASCVRPASKQEIHSSFMFEVTAVSHEYISVTFEHPQEDSTATAEINLNDICNVRCRLHTLTPDATLCSDEYATKVLQRCLSIPVTMRAVMKKVVREVRKDLFAGGDTAVTIGGKMSSDFNQNTKFLLSDFERMGMRRDQVMLSHMNGLNSGNVMTNSGQSPGYQGSPHSQSMHSNESAMEGSDSDCSFGYSVPYPIPCKSSPHQSFLDDSKVVKVRKKKLKSGDDSEVRDKTSLMSSSDAELALEIERHRRDLKVEKVQSALPRRRASSENGDCRDLAELREKVYGAGCGASLEKFIPKNAKKLKKTRSESSSLDSSQKSPIILDLTNADSIQRKLQCDNSISSSSSSSSLSAALLKRSGIEIIPIPGAGNSSISIPASITVTPVIKSDIKLKDRKERKDRKDEKKEKKRKREDSPMGAGKLSKVQILDSSLKSSFQNLEKFKSDSSKLSLSLKPNTPPYQSPSKKSLSPSSKMQPKVSYGSPKGSKPTYSPTSSQSSKIAVSTKFSIESSKNSMLSPKHTGMGKPSVTTLKSSSFSKNSLSPKTAKSKECSSNVTSQSYSKLQGCERSKPIEALTITKVSTSDTSLTSSFASSLPSMQTVSNTIHDKTLNYSCLEKAKASPPKPRKGSSLSDIVDKLRAGVGGSNEGSVTIIERRDRERKEGKLQSSVDSKKESPPNKRAEFTIKHSSGGLKLTINKSKKEKNASPNSKFQNPRALAALKQGNILSQSKKISVSSLPPIPKLPPSSVSNVTATTVSPLGSSMHMTQNTPLIYQRDRSKERLIKSKDTNTGKLTPEMKRDGGLSPDKQNLCRSSPKDDLRSGSKNPDSSDRNAKSMLHEDEKVDLKVRQPPPHQILPLNVEGKGLHYYHDSVSTSESLFGDSFTSRMQPPAYPKSQGEIKEMDVSPVGKLNMLEKPFHPMSINSHDLSPLASYPPSPTLSIKIVKSPAAAVGVTSPLTMMSPHSLSAAHSPCIIDDDLMDEALMGSRK